MPTMTNPETGETKEISMEEFMKMKINVFYLAQS